MPAIRVHFLPELVEPESLVGGTAVVIDVLRATTTIVQALAAGAREVVVCGEVEEARSLSVQFQPGTCVWGGERGGLTIDGFDLGNSPAEYTEATVGGKTVIFTTTNGTRALLHCRRAERILVAAFTNLSAVCEAIKDDPRVDLICAGTRGRFSREDVLLAGAIVDHLVPDSSTPIDLDDQAAIARGAWRSVPREEMAVDKKIGSWLHDDPKLRAAVDQATASFFFFRELCATQGGRDLMELDRLDDNQLSVDIAHAAIIDEWSIAPRYDPQTGRITLA